MALAVPISTAFETALGDRTSAKWWKLLVDTDDDGVLEDVTGKLSEGVTVSRKSGGARGEAVSNSASATLRNADQSLTEGDWAGAKAAIEAKVGSSSEYIRVLTGWVSSGGLKRQQTYLTDDTAELEIVDYVERVGTKRKVDPAVYVNHAICDPASEPTSLFHKLADAMGLDTADLDVTEIANVKDYLAIGDTATAWSELKLLAAQYLGLLTFRYDGKLRLSSRFETGYSDPTSEWTLDDSNVHQVAAIQVPVQCNRVSTEFESYQQLDERVVYKNTENYDKTTKQIDLAVAASEYWPGPGSGSKAQLQYRDPKSGEQWPLAISIQTPTIGTTGSGSDIEYTGGTLALVSFNGSTSATRQLPDRSELILQNTGGSTCTITKMTLRGQPLRVQKQIRVEALDATITDDWRYIDKTINGKYASAETQAWLTCKWWRDFGYVPRKRYELKTDFLPHLQEGCAVQFDHPTNGTSGVYVIEKVEHPSVALPIDGRQYTRLTITEQEIFDATGSPSDVVEDNPGNSETEEQDASPTFDDLNDGWDVGTGTTVPETPTAEARAYFKAIVVSWTEQLTLTNLSYYDVQVSDDDATWYALRFDGVDWKAGLGGTTRVDDEQVIHTSIPPAGTTDAPTGRTLYYRVRQVTKDGTTSSWSASVNATTTGIDTVDITEDAITAPKILAGAVTADKVSAAFLNAVIAEITGELKISSEGIEGIISDAARVLITGTKQAFQVLVGGTWVDRITFGGNPEALLPDLLRAQGLVKTGADVSGLDVGDSAPAGSTRFNFDNDYLDESDLDPWDTKTALAFTTNSRYGSHALTTGSADGRLVDNDAQGIALDTDFSLAAWAYASALPGSAVDVARLLSREWAQKGASLTGVNNSAPAVTALSTTRIAYIGRDDGNLRTYEWSGSAWSQVGNSLSLGSIGVPGLATLDSTTVAYADSTNDELRTYSWDGTDWTQAGTGLSISTMGFPRMSALSTSTIAFVDGGNDELRTYEWSGSAWSQVGNGLALGSIAGASVTALTSTTVAYSDSVNNELRTYAWNGTDWSQTGSALAMGASSGLPAMTTLNEHRIVYVDSDTDDLRTYDWDGSTWSQIGSGTAVVGVGYPSVAALTEYSIAFVDADNGELRTYMLAAAVIRHDGSNNLKLEWDGPSATASSTVAISAGWAYFSVHFDTSADTLQLVVNGTAQTALDVSADTALTHGLALELLLPGTSYRLDDLLVMPGTLLTTTDSIEHYNSGYAWAESDYGKDLFLMAKDGGKINVLSSVESDGLPVFQCRAWVNFDGTSVDGSNHCTIRGSGNIDHVERLATGQYRVVFTDAMPDAGYSVSMQAVRNSINSDFFATLLYGGDFLSTHFDLVTQAASTGSGLENSPLVTVSVFR